MLLNFYFDGILLDSFQSPGKKKKYSKIHSPRPVFNKIIERAFLKCRREMMSTHRNDDGNEIQKTLIVTNLMLNENDITNYIHTIYECNKCTNVNRAIYIVRHAFRKSKSKASRANKRQREREREDG